MTRTTRCPLPASVAHAVNNFRGLLHAYRIEQLLLSRPFADFNQRTSDSRSLRPALAFHPCGRNLLTRAQSATILFPTTLFELRSQLSRKPGDIVIALSHRELISFGVPWHGGGKGIVGLRRSDMLPLSLPNTIRNVVAHELGHVLGLAHNADSTTLMCGRPAACRPAAFASDSAYFFPLTAATNSASGSAGREILIANPPSCSARAYFAGIGPGIAAKMMRVEHAVGPPDCSRRTRPFLDNTANR